MAQDYAQALNWYRNAAEQGNPDGQFNLASLLEHGQGTAVDVNQAVMYRLGELLDGGFLVG